MKWNIRRLYLGGQQARASQRLFSQARRETWRGGQGEAGFGAGLGGWLGSEDVLALGNQEPGRQWETL